MMLLLTLINLIFTNYVVIEENEFITKTLNPINTLNSLQTSDFNPIKEPYNEMIQNNDIFIITRELCGWSRKMREFLKDRKVKFKEFETSNDKKAKVLEDVGLSGHTFPVVFFKGKYIGGYSDSINSNEFIDYVNKQQNKINKQQ